MLRLFGNFLILIIIKKMKKFIIYVFMIIFMISFVSSNSDWVQWGNAGAIYATNSELNHNMFGSNFPQGSIDFVEENTLTGSFTVQPIIYDLNQDGKNEIFGFTTSSIRIYDNEANIIKAVNVDGDIQGLGTIAIYDSKPALIIMTKTDDDDYFINILEDNFKIDDVINVTSDNNYMGHVLGGLSMSDQTEAYLVQNNNNVVTLDLDTATYTTFEPDLQELTRDYSSVILEGGMIAIKDIVTSDTYIGYASKSSGVNDININIYNTNEEDSCSAVAIAGAGSSVTKISVGSGIIGSKTSSPYFVLMSWQETSSIHYIEIFDTECNKVEEILLNYGTTRHKPQYCISDVNHDSANEFCFLNDTIFTCKDGSFDTIMRYNLSSSYTPELYFACAEYDNNNSYHEIIFPEGIFEFSNNGNLTQILDLGLDGEKGMFMPTSVYNQESFIKDLVFATTDKIVYFVSSGTAGVCGNGICESGETVYNCETDCFDSVLEGAINGTGAGCIQDSDCYTGNCEYGFCVLQGDNEECVNDNQCLSGECTNGKCAKASYWDRIDASKTQQYGNDSKTNNFIALFFMLGIPILFLIYGAKTGIYGAIASFFVLSFFFTIVGWLSIFILFGIILVALVILVLGFMLSGDSS